MESFELRRVNIRLSEVFESCFAAEYRFVFFCNESGAADCRFRFSLPELAAVSGFEAENGEFCARSVNKAAPDGEPGVVLTQLTETLYEIYFDRIPCRQGNFIVTLRATVIPELTGRECKAVLPLYTEGQRRIDTDRSDSCECTVPVIITAQISSPTERIYSPSDKYDVRSGKAGAVLTAHTRSGGSFSICIRYRGKCDSRGYICRNPRSATGMGYHCFYRLMPETIRPPIWHSISVVLDTDGGTPSQKAAAIKYAELLAEFCRAEIMTAAAAKSVWDVIYVASAVPDNLTVRPGMKLSFVLTGSRKYAEDVRRLCRLNGGVFSCIEPGEDIREHARGFAKVILGGMVDEVRIREYCPGVYYMAPDTVCNYRIGAPLYVAMGTETDYPREFELSGSGYHEVVAIEDIRLLENVPEVGEGFGRLAIDSIYGLIRSGADPESVVRLKKTAAAIAEEVNILCPDNCCSVSFGSTGGAENTRPLLITLRHRAPEFDRALIPLMDSAAGGRLQAAVCALLCFVRPDGGITEPFERPGRTAAEQTAYACAALCRVKGDFTSIISEAEAFIKRMGFSPRGFSVTFNSDLPSPEEYGVIGLSRFILSVTTP